MVQIQNKQVAVDLKMIEGKARAKLLDTRDISLLSLFHPSFDFQVTHEKDKEAIYLKAIYRCDMRVFLQIKALRKCIRNHISPKIHHKQPKSHL